MMTFHKSSQYGFELSMSSNFQLRCHRLIAFSRAIASLAVFVQLETSVVTPYLLCE